MSRITKSEPQRASNSSRFMFRHPDHGKLVCRSSVMKTEEVTGRGLRRFSRTGEADSGLSDKMVPFHDSKNPVRNIPIKKRVESKHISVSTHSDVPKEIHPSRPHLDLKGKKGYSQQGDGLRTVSRVQTLGHTSASLDENGDFKFEFVLFEVASSSSKKLVRERKTKSGPHAKSSRKSLHPNRLLTSVKSQYVSCTPLQNESSKTVLHGSRRSSIRQKLTTKSRHTPNIGPRVISSKSLSLIRTKNKMKRYIFKGRTAAEGSNETKRDKMPQPEQFNQSPVRKIRAPTPKELRDYTKNIQELLEKLEDDESLKEETPAVDSSDLIQSEVLDSVHNTEHAGNSEVSSEDTIVNSATSTTRRNQSFNKQTLSAITEEKLPTWDSCVAEECSTLNKNLEKNANLPKEAQVKSKPVSRGQKPLQKTWSTLNVSRTLRANVTTENILPNYEVCSPSRKTLQLMERVRLLRNLLSRPQSSPGGNPNCPIFSEGPSQVSSMNVGVGDMNYDQMVYPSLSTPKQRPISRFDNKSAVSWTKSLTNSISRLTNKQTSTDPMSTQRSNFKTKNSDEISNAKRRNRYLESFLDVRVLPKQYKFHFRTDICISLTILVLFLGVQFLIYHKTQVFEKR